MKSDTDLDLVFKNAIGKKVTLNIEEPKPGVTKWKPWKAVFAPSPGTWWLSNPQPATE